MRAGAKRLKWSRCGAARPVNIGLMRLIEEIDVLNPADVKHSKPVKSALADVRSAIAGVHWPSGSGSFTIYPESGKKSGMGNGVVPIKTAFIEQLRQAGWTPEMPFPLPAAPGGATFGAMDAAKTFGGKPFVVEWETGNISSSHRALNKIGLGLAKGAIGGGVLVVPTKEFAQYLTDRIGNVYELRSYVPLWAAIQTPQPGYLGIISVQHDETSLNVPKITKGTDGRALR